MKRKPMCLLVVLIMTAILCLPASADILWAPYGNLFYKSHSDECEVVDRGYVTNGEKGYVSVVTAPDSPVQVENLANGTCFRVVHVWTDRDGTQWGTGYLGGETEGWVKMEEMALLYDDKAFREDHGDELAAYDGSGDHLAEVCLYHYPGGAYSRTLTENAAYLSFAEAFTDLYTDENGLRWAYIGYYMGRNNLWACLDDPMNENLGTENRLTVQQVRTQIAPLPASDEIPAPRSMGLWLVPSGLVAGAAVAAAVILRMRKKQK